ncbi:MAG: hypothetical protein JSU66_01545 [Deltaproteobacteria bacterium]|nr:MAG: hypothetical protein JSU66_01545 [Deltaproteobacteria bacterium]
MEKLVYLLWDRRAHDGDAMARWLLDACAPALLELGARGLSINVNDADANAPAPLPTPAGEIPLGAEVSLWLDCHDRRAPFDALLRSRGHRVAAYLVTESLYTDYGGNAHSGARDWPDGVRSPGLLTVSLLEKPEPMDDDTWYAHWYGVQSPVSEAIQPRARYVRNAVARRLDADAPPYRGIVEEAWPSAEHVRDPMLFYRADGSQERLRRHIERMLESVNAFLELPRLRVVTMSEYLLRSPTA